MEEYSNSKNHNARLASAGRSLGALSQDISVADNWEQQLLADLTDLVLRPVQGGPSAIRDLVTRTGVTSEAMADIYIPTVARNLGDQWCEDQLGFAEVTIGSARLQSMLRDLGEGWAADLETKPDASTVLLVVPDAVHHTLGAFVLAGQLRRKGLSVRLMLGATPGNIHEQGEHAHYDAVFISACTGDKLETLRKIVDSVRQVQHAAPPVLIGGTLLETNADVVALTGTDYIANTADEAIALCNLRTKPRINAALDL